ncbi:MAG: amidohydrolase family protein [Proteobacteria bacterium]|nr:amidohydrolase family protein [Pseudomonadota bacterium]
MLTEQGWLIRDVEILDAQFKPARVDVRLTGGRLAEIGSLSPVSGEQVVAAGGRLLLPGIHDHHVHLAAMAASLSSVDCSPAAVTSPEELAASLHDQPGTDWLRGIGYHESVAGPLDRDWLDRHGPDRPVRIQHRTGTLWIVNSRGLDILRALAASTLSDADVSGRLASDGRLYDCDDLIGLTRQEPPIATVSQQLSSWGVTGVNDMTVSNDPQTLRWFDRLQHNGELLQRVRLSGAASLPTYQDAWLGVGETKIYLHDHQLPVFTDMVQQIRDSHLANRPVAIHCVTEAELVFSLAALEEGGLLPGDRIEHGSVIPDALLSMIRSADLLVVTQPNFVAERGDTYLAEVPVDQQPSLYRCRSLIESGIWVAFGTDMPFGHPDPWRAMAAATRRTTVDGVVLGAGETVTPEMALTAFLGELSAPATPRILSVGADADLCLMDLPWMRLREDLDSRHVVQTWVNGRSVYG